MVGDASIAEASGISAQSPRVPSQGWLREVVVLAGGVRDVNAGQSFGALVLDLPLSESETVLQAWRHRVTELSKALGLPSLQLRAVVNRGWTPIRPISSSGGVPVEIQPEPEELRGTGGMLHDIAEGFGDDDFLLAATASQIMLRPLSEIIAAEPPRDADVVIYVNPDDSPCGLQLIRARVLRHINDKGFIDLKEQALPAMVKAQARIRVVRCSLSPTVSLRTLEAYIGAVRSLQSNRGAMLAEPSPFAEDWSPTFKLVDPEATVAAATIHDSAILRGASIGAGAVVVRSVIGEGVSVSPGELVLDRIVLKLPGRGRPATPTVQSQSPTAGTNGSGGASR